jgi:hypothetical protein
MRRLGFLVGVVLLLLAAAAGIAEILSLLVGTGTTQVSIGSIWYGINANSLVGFQALIEKNIGPWAWSPVQSFFVLPAWLTLGIPGLVLVGLCRPRRRSGDWL